MCVCIGGVGEGRRGRVRPGPRVGESWSVRCQRRAGPAGCPAWTKGEAEMHIPNGGGVELRPACLLAWSPRGWDPGGSKRDARGSSMHGGWVGSWGSTENHWWSSIAVIFQEFTFWDTCSWMFSPTHRIPPRLPCVLPFAPNTTKSTTNTNPRGVPVTVVFPGGPWWDALLLIAPTLTFWLPSFYHLPFPNCFCWSWFPVAINFGSLAVLADSLSAASLAESQGQGVTRPPWVAFLAPGHVVGPQSCSCAPQTRSAWSDLGVTSRCLSCCTWQQLVNCQAPYKCKPLSLYSLCMVTRLNES